MICLRNRDCQSLCLLVRNCCHLCHHLHPPMLHLKTPSLRFKTRSSFSNRCCHLQKVKIMILNIINVHHGQSPCLYHKDHPWPGTLFLNKFTKRWQSDSTIQQETNYWVSVIAPIIIARQVSKEDKNGQNHVLSKGGAGEDLVDQESEGADLSGRIHYQEGHHLVGGLQFHGRLKLGQVESGNWASWRI